jgi:hypothetical protein
MNRPVKIFLMLMGAALAGQAGAFEQLVGEYLGKLSSLEAYDGKVGDPCAVRITRSDMFGGSLFFEILNIDKILMANREVQKALERKADTVRIFTPAAQGRSAEAVLLTVGEDRSLKAMKLFRRWNQQQAEKYAVCSELVKK